MRSPSLQIRNDVSKKRPMAKSVSVGKSFGAGFKTGGIGRIGLQYVRGDPGQDGGSLFSQDGDGGFYIMRPGGGGDLDRTEGSIGEVQRPDSHILDFHGDQLGA